MGSGSGRAGQQQQQQAGPALSAALSAAEERRRHLLLRQHPGLAMLEAGPARVRTLRLYLDNPEFSSLKALACLGHLRELSLVVSRWQPPTSCHPCCLFQIQKDTSYR